MAEIQLTAVERAIYVNGAKQSFDYPLGIIDSDSYGRKIGILFEIPASCKMKKCKLRLDSACSGMTPLGAGNVVEAVAYLIDNTQAEIFPSSGTRFITDNIHDNEGEASWNRLTYLFKDNHNYAGASPYWIYNWANGHPYPYNGDPSNYFDMGAVITTANYIVINVWAYNASAYLQNVDLYIEPIDDICFTIPTYPIDVNINKTSDTTFTWNLYNNVAIGLNFNTPPTQKHKVQYREKGSSTVQEISQTDTNNYQTVPANTFDIKHYEYQIVAYTYYDLPMYGTEWKEFNVVGQNAAPIVTGVSNDAIPTVVWTDQNQAAFEIRIKNATQKIIYTSGLIVGTNLSYKINKMLTNGQYTVEVRELNIYGIYSDWGSRAFTISPSAVAAPTNIFVTVNNKYGVEISGTPVSGATQTYVVRREVGSDDIEIIGIYMGGIYTDYTAKGNTYYEYTLRNYNTAYADGAFVPVEVKVGEALIQDGRDVTNFLDLSWSENATFDLERTEEADRTLYNCLGRKYPVKEMGEWVNSVRTFTAYVKDEDLDRLREINLNAPKVYYKGDHEYFACDMSIEDNGAYVGGGRLIGFTFTRIADDEGTVI